MGFDELNVINTNSDNTKKNDDKNSKPIDLTSQLSNALADYKTVWDKS